MGRSRYSFFAELAVDPEAMARFLRDPDATSNGSLVCVGTGIRSAGQLTVEAIAWIRLADSVPYLVVDPVAEEVIRRLNPRGAESLAGLYAAGKRRHETYREMVERILEHVRAGRQTCAVFYGHPGVFVAPSHDAIRAARAEGFEARMLPGISAEDCLFADLGFDPATEGCQTYEATDFLLNHRRLDPTSHAVIWQVGVLGDLTHRVEVHPSNPLDLLVERLARVYPADHEVVVYEAAILPGEPARIERLRLARLRPDKLSVVSTLYVPPAEPPRFDFGLYYALTWPAKKPRD